MNEARGPAVAASYACAVAASILGTDDDDDDDEGAAVDLPAAAESLLRAAAKPAAVALPAAAVVAAAADSFLRAAPSPRALSQPQLLRPDDLPSDCIVRRVSRPGRSLVGFSARRSSSWSCQWLETLPFSCACSSSSSVNLEWLAPSRADLALSRPLLPRIAACIFVAASASSAGGDAGGDGGSRFASSSSPAR